MSAIDDAVTRLRQCAKPVMFETCVENAPYAGVGTCFLVKLGAQLFLVTARHVVEGESLDRLLVFPNEESNESIPFSAGFTVANRDPGDPDCSDFVFVKVHLGNLRLADQSRTHAMDLDKASDSWRTAPFDHRFVLFGYPSQSREFDYDRFKIVSTQRFLVGRFAKMSSASYCYELDIEDFNGVDDLNGLSGSPVVSWPRMIGDHFHPSFCGMVLRGTRTSGKVHFLDAAVLRKALEFARDN